MALSFGVVLAFVVALVSKLLRLNLLSRLAQQVTFVLIPPLLLIFLVLGTIFLGIATPTEGGAMGAVGALALATVRRKLNWSLARGAELNRQAVEFRDLRADRIDYLQPDLPGHRWTRSGSNTCSTSSPVGRWDSWSWSTC